MKYKALMLDIDGTLCPHGPNDGALLPTKRVSQAINKVRNQINLCLVTARPLDKMQSIIKHLKLTGYAILLNGAQIIDMKSGQTVWDKLIEPSDIEKIIRIGKNHHKSLVYYNDLSTDKEGDISLLHGLALSNIFFPQVPAEEISQLETELTSIPTLSAHRILMTENNSVGLGVNHVLATKQHAIVNVAKLLDIDTSEIIGVGDGPNDFPLLIACGLKIAMGNAVPELKAIADFIAPSVEEDGVATVIEKFILP